MMDQVLCLIILDEDGKEDGFIPLYDHPHNDVENGQSEVHYHVDLRYTDRYAYHTPKACKRTADLRIDLPLLDNEKLEYRNLEIQDETFNYVTPVEYIKNSKLKHKCIHKGRCPHRGYDLSNVTPKNGIIECPLHGLHFDATTKQLV